MTVGVTVAGGYRIVVELLRVKKSGHVNEPRVKNIFKFHSDGGSV
jgi:hypothetical protein